jgi:hypothetical protein
MDDTIKGGAQDWAKERIVWALTAAWNAVFTAVTTLWSKPENRPIVACVFGAVLALSIVLFLIRWKSHRDALRTEARRAYEERKSRAKRDADPQFLEAKKFVANLIDADIEVRIFKNEVGYSCIEAPGVGKFVQLPDFGNHLPSAMRDLVEDRAIQNVPGTTDLFELTSFERKKREKERKVNEERKAKEAAEQAEVERQRAETEKQNKRDEKSKALVEAWDQLTKSIGARPSPSPQIGPPKKTKGTANPSN